MVFASLRAIRLGLISSAAVASYCPSELGAEPPEAEPPAEPKVLSSGLGGLRTALAHAGIELGVTYIGEAFDTVTGGLKRGATYEGQLGVSLDADLGKLTGWPGATLHANAIDIHGVALWWEQSLFDDGVSARAGQLAADAEFITSETAGGLSNGTFGWPLLTAADMRGGGPAYPLPQPGVRLHVKPAEDLALRAAVYSGQPGGPGCADNPQLCDPHGVAFSLSGGTLWLAEIEYAANAGQNAAGLPGTYKLGGWRETGAFSDQLLGALNRRGDWGVYGIIDQMVWRRPGTADQGLGFFMRMGGAPSDRNLVSWYADGGIGFKAPFANLPDDVLTLGMAYGRISDGAALADRIAGQPTPVRDHEAVIELSYAASIIPGWTVRPDLQYVMHPGGNPPNPNGGGAIGNALVLGLRTSFAF